MSYPSPKIRELIIRFLKKEASDPELDELREWLQSDKKNLEYFDQINTLFQEESVLNTFDKSKMQDAWKNLESRINKTGGASDQARIFPYRFLQIAASISLVALAAWFFMERETPAKHETILVENSTASTMLVTLPDSTFVWLNLHSSLEYNDDFDTQRKVTLRGEAFFDVRKKFKSNFIVQTPLFSIQVKGTRFNVQAYESQVKKATLEEGEIELTMTGSSEKYAMIPGDQILIDHHQQTITRQKVNTESYTAWKEEEIVFDNTPLSDIIIKLENRFRVEIEIDEALAKREHFSLTIQDETIEEILEMIQLSSNLKYKTENKTIVIYE